MTEWGNRRGCPSPDGYSHRRDCFEANPDQVIIMPSGLQVLTIVHVAISLVAIASGFVVVFGLIAGKRLNLWTAIFLATTIATSVTGFAFPIHGFTPGIGLGIVSMVVLAVALVARYARQMTGIWRRVYVVTAVVALYLNVLVLIVQSFRKVPALKAMAPNQSEPPFLIAQVTAMVVFIVLGILAAIRFRDHSVIAA
jgi:hypothetical protein